MSRHYLVVGGSRGLGRAFAEQLTAERAAVSTIARSRAGVTNVREYACDLCDCDQVVATLDTIAGDIVACVGQGAWENEALDDTRQLDRLFRDKRIPAWVDFWGQDVDHDWPWWHQQMYYFLDYLYRRDS